MAQCERLIIIGSGGMARDALWFAREAAEPFDVLGMLDDDPASHGSDRGDCPVLGPIDDWARYDASLVVAIGSPRVRRTIVRRIEESGRPRWATVAHRSSHHSNYVEFGVGSMVGAGCVVTTQVQVGDHVIVNNGCTIAHDVVLDEFVTLAPRVAISGAVHVRAGGEIGTGACLRQGIVVGQGSMVGMGGAAIRDVADNTLVMGVPAQEKRVLPPFEMD